MPDLIRVVRNEFINLRIKIVLPCCNFKSDHETFVKDGGREGNRYDVQESLFKGKIKTKWL